MLFGDPENEDIVSRDTKFAGGFLRGEKSAVLLGALLSETLWVDCKQTSARGLSSTCAELQPWRPCALQLRLLEPCDLVGHVRGKTSFSFGCHMDCSLPVQIFLELPLWKEAQSQWRPSLMTWGLVWSVNSLVPSIFQSHQMGLYNDSWIQIGLFQMLLRPAIPTF